MNEVEKWVNVADTLQGLGKAHEALALYQRALQVEPGRVDARNNLGNAFLALSQYNAAADCYHAALEIRPDDARILCNLANAQRRLGLLDEAIASSRRAIAHEPTLSFAHNILGLSLAALGRRDAAVASYRQSLTLNPQYVEALNNLGDVLRDLGRHREALPLYARAVELEPNRAESHCNLGNLLLETGQLDAAVASFQRALELQPQDARAHLCLAAALRRRGCVVDAAARCRAVLANDPRCVDALFILGELRADQGHFAEAVGFFQRVILLDANFAAAFCGIAALRKMSCADTPWLQGVDTLLARHPTLRQEIGLRYALGKYYDDLGQYDTAFEQYRQANELSKRCGPPYDPGKLTRHVDEIINLVDAELLDTCRSICSDTELPVFIVGMPRSGTSLTEQILASHPAVCGVGELTFWGGAFVAYQKGVLVGSDRAGLRTAMGLIARFSGDYLERLTALCRGASRVIDKMPANFLYLGLIHAALPKAKIIHIQRHAMDTCLSIYFQNFMDMGPYANDLGHLAHYYGEYQRIMEHWRAVLPAAALLEISYEALIEDQEGTTRRLLDFLDLPWDSKCLDFHNTDRVCRTASQWQVRQRIHAASVGRWRHYARFVRPLRGLVDADSLPHGGTESVSSAPRPAHIIPVQPV